MDQEKASKEENGSAGNNEEIYRYGLFLLKHDLVNIVVSLAIGTLLGCLRECAAFTVSYMMLRRYMGGYHASCPLICVVESVAMLTVSSILAHLVKPSMVILIIADVVFLTQYPRIPVETENRPLDGSERNVFKKISFAVVVIYTIIALLFLEYGWLYNSILYAMICCECLSIIQMVLNALKRDDKYVEKCEIDGC